jgi:hypothetical protein
MSTSGDRAIAAWRLEARAVLARAARARGIDGISVVIPFKRLLDVVSRLDVELAASGVSQAPSEEEMDALAHRAVLLLQQYRRLEPPAQMGSDPPQPAGPELPADQSFLRFRGRQERALADVLATDAQGPGDAPAAGEPWSAHFELGDVLTVVTRPLTGLPSFVKKLELWTGDIGTTLRASKLRSGPGRIRVPVSTTPYTWSGGDFDDEIGEMLDALELPGFPKTRATAFRVSATGVGLRVDGAMLLPGRAYRLLVPPGITPPARRSIEGVRADEDWQVVELDLPAVVPALVEARLSRLGLLVAGAGLDLEIRGC